MITDEDHADALANGIVPMSSNVMAAARSRFSLTITKLP